MTATQESTAVNDEKVWGVLAEFETAEALTEAAKEVRDAGFSRWDTHSPYPIHGMEKAMGMPMTILPWLVFFGGLTGACLGMGMQQWMNSVDYPFIVSGKPWIESIPAFIPVTFELTVLFSALTAFGGMIVLNGLPRFYHPTFNSERFRRVTDDGFFISIEASDAEYSTQRTHDFLVTLGATHVEELPE